MQRRNNKYGKALYFGTVKAITHYHHCPLGWLKITTSDVGLTSLGIVASKPEDHENPLVPLIDRCCVQLDEYFAGQRKSFDLPMDLDDAPAFYKRVWLQLIEIPYGATTTYGHIAQDIGQPQASQAVGQANGKNPIAIIIPCHRVIGSQGRLTGYAWGIEKKIKLLQLERAHSPVPPGQLF